MWIFLIYLADLYVHKYSQYFKNIFIYLATPGLSVTHRIFDLRCGKQGLLPMAGKLLAVACGI